MICEIQFPMIGKSHDLVVKLLELWKDKYYCFNHHPGREDVALTYTLEKCDMDKQLDESLASLRRLHGSRT